MGAKLRAVAGHPVARRLSADLPRRRLLFARHAAGGMAHGDAVQSRRLSDQRVPLDLLRQGRCRDRGQYGRGRLLPGAVPDRKSVVSGKSVSVRVDLGGRRIIKKKRSYKDTNYYTSTTIQEIASPQHTQT